MPYTQQTTTFYGLDFLHIIGAPRNHTTIIVRQYDNRTPPQIWSEYSFTTGVKRINIAKCEHTQLAALTIKVTTPNTSRVSSLPIMIGE